MWILVNKNSSNNKPQKNVAVVSYNSRGFSYQKQEFCKALTSVAVIGDNLPMLCNQENFLLAANVYKINQTFQNYHCFINPAIKTSHDKGRGKNGMFIAIPNIIKNLVEDVSPGFWRIQAVIIKFPSSSTLLINTYCPVDPKDNSDNADLIENSENITKVKIQVS